jgi:hypothetical protein
MPLLMFYSRNEAGGLRQTLRSWRSRFREVSPRHPAGRFYLATHETNYLSQKNKISPSTRVKGPEKFGTHGGNCGYTSNFCTYPGLLAPSGWTDYGSGTGAGLMPGGQEQKIMANPMPPRPTAVVSRGTRRLFCCPRSQRTGDRSRLFRG